MAKIDNKNNAINLGLSDFAKQISNTRKQIRELNVERSKWEKGLIDLSNKQLNKNEDLVEVLQKRLSLYKEIERIKKSDKEVDSSALRKQIKEYEELRKGLGKREQKKIDKDVILATSVLPTATQELKKLGYGTLGDDFKKIFRVPEMRNYEAFLKKGKELNLTGKDLSAFMSRGASLDVASFAMKEVGKLFNKIESLTKQLFKNIWTDAKKMLDDVATYSLSTSYITNASARNQAITYGLSDAQNYAFTQVKSLMGISSDEDLYYMNTNQREMFNKLMTQYSELYEQMNSSGQLADYQEIQLTWKELKAEWSATIVKFFSENKDTIIGFMNAGMSFMSFVMNGLSALVNFFTGNGSSGGLDYLSNATAVSSSNIRTNNVTFYNTANANSVSDANSLVNSIAGVNAVQAMNFMES